MAVIAVLVKEDGRDRLRLYVKVTRSTLRYGVRVPSYVGQ